MARESIRSSGAVSASESTFTGLRRFNLIMGFLHLIQGIFMIFVSNDKTYPIFTNYLTFDIATRSLKPNPQLFARPALSGRRWPASCSSRRWRTSTCPPSATRATSRT